MQEERASRAKKREQWRQDYCTDGCTVCMQKRGAWSYYNCDHMFCPPCMRANKNGRCPVCRLQHNLNRVPPNREYCLTKEQRVALNPAWVL